MSFTCVNVAALPISFNICFGCSKEPSHLDDSFDCCLLITIANSLDPDQARQNVLPDLGPNCLTLMAFLKVLDKFILKKNLQTKKKAGKVTQQELKPLCFSVFQRLALEMHLQHNDSNKYSPLPVAIPKSDGQLADQQSIPYPQFLVAVKQQISCAKELYTMLTEFTSKLTDRGNIG